MSLAAPIQLAALPHKRIIDHVYQVIRHHIVSRAFVPGQRLRGNDLALQLGVSRTPVKYALNLLATEGLIKINPRRGTFVTDLTVEEIVETFEVRQALELAAGERLVQTISVDGLRQLEDVLRKAEGIHISSRAQDDLVEKHLRLNFEFHDLLVQLSGNRKLLEAYRGLNAAIQIALIHYRAPEWKRRISREQREHRAILKALQQRNAQALEVAIRTHLRRAKLSLVADMQMKPTGKADRKEADSPL